MSIAVQVMVTEKDCTLLTICTMMQMTQLTAEVKKTTEACKGMAGIALDVKALTASLQDIKEQLQFIRKDCVEEARKAYQLATTLQDTCKQVVAETQKLSAQATAALPGLQYQTQLVSNEVQTDTVARVQGLGKPESAEQLAPSLQKLAEKPAGWSTEVSLAGGMKLNQHAAYQHTCNKALHKHSYDMDLQPQQPQFPQRKLPVSSHQVGSIKHAGFIKGLSGAEEIQEATQHEHAGAEAAIQMPVRQGIRSRLTMYRKSQAKANATGYQSPAIDSESPSPSAIQGICQPLDEPQQAAARPDKGITRSGRRYQAKGAHTHKQNLQEPAATQQRLHDSMPDLSSVPWQTTTKPGKHMSLELSSSQQEGDTPKTFKRHSRPEKAVSSNKQRVSCHGSLSSAPSLKLSLHPLKYSSMQQGNRDASAGRKVPIPAAEVPTLHTQADDSKEYRKPVKRHKAQQHSMGLDLFSKLFAQAGEVPCKELPGMPVIQADQIATEISMRLKMQRMRRMQS